MPARGRCPTYVGDTALTKISNLFYALPMTISCAQWLGHREAQAAGQVALAAARAV